MKLKKYFSFKSDKLIWRLLFSELNKLIIEERDPVKREVSFSCIDAEKGGKIFKDMQLSEKFWIGIEIVYKDYIIFHNYRKPDMPGHKGIIIYDISSKKVLWQNDDLIYLLINDDKIYAFRHDFEDKYYVALNIYTGEIKEEIGKDDDRINLLKKNQYNPYNFQKFSYPEIYRMEQENNSETGDIINKITSGRTIIGNVEYILKGDILFFNFFEKNKKNSLLNRFFAVKLITGELMLDTILSENANAYVPDSFFLKENNLYLLKNKNEVSVFSII
jgi:hypothetical protein